ncbi:MAG: Uma2 family endonuclease [Lachnospiraceae bacterium]|nr:Uma2 family endonuclease [Lachnospiraceae bacterium]
MTVEEMKKKKQEKGYSYAQMAELSGVPVGTIQKIFSGETTSPRYDTLQALEHLFAEQPMVQEEQTYQVHAQGSYTVDDYRALPEEQRVELIDGCFYDMAAPTFLHQQIAGEIHRQIANYILDHGGSCRPLIAPVDVQLDCDEKTMVQPDVGILCHEDKIEKWGVYGAPDFVLEIVSPSTRRKDCIKKLDKYMDAGVREYWILDPDQKKLLVYLAEGEACPIIYGLDHPVPIRIYDGALEICLENILKWIREAEDK